MRKFNTDKLIYGGSDGGEFNTHYFNTKACDLIQLSCDDAGWYSCLRVSTTKDGEFGDFRDMPEAFTQMLLERVPALAA